MSQWQIEACDGNHCAAALMSLLEYIHNERVSNAEESRKMNDIAERHGDKGTQSESLFHGKSVESWKRSLLGLFSDDSIREALGIIKAKGFITVSRNPNPRYSFDKTAYYRFEPDAVNAWLDARKIGNAGKEKRASLPKKPLSLIEVTVDVDEGGTDHPKGENPAIEETKPKPREESFPETPKGGAGNSPNGVASIGVKEGDKQPSTNAQEATAIWIQCYNAANSIPYANGMAKRRRADSAAMSGLLAGGVTLEQVRDVTERMFKAAKSAANGKVVWWATRCRTVENFALHFNEISGELDETNQRRNQGRAGRSAGTTNEGNHNKYDGF
jgi:hypothetical protein